MTSCLLDLHIWLVLSCSEHPHQSCRAQMFVRSGEYCADGGSAGRRLWRRDFSLGLFVG